MEPRKYEFIEINNFIVAQASAEHFEADFKLYRKLFPESRILRDLENPFPPQKKELDERMLFEILNADRICMETILENRGIILPAKEEVKQPGEFETVDSAAKVLRDLDLRKLTYNELKALTFKLKLNVPDQKSDTLRSALEEAQGAIFVKDLSISPEPKPEDTNEEAPIDPAQQLPIEEKKS